MSKLMPTLPGPHMAVSVGGDVLMWGVQEAFEARERWRQTEALVTIFARLLQEIDKRTQMEREHATHTLCAFAQMLASARSPEEQRRLLDAIRAVQIEEDRRLRLHLAPASQQARAILGAPAQGALR